MNSKKILSIDIETVFSKDLSKCGVYACCEDKEFHILLFAYAFDNEEVKIIDFTKNEKLPKEVLEALLDDNIIKSAFNANFERICISAYLNLYLSPKSWKCSEYLFIFSIFHYNLLLRSFGLKQCQ